MEERLTDAEHKFLSVLQRYASNRVSIPQYVLRLVDTAAQVSESDKIHFVLQVLTVLTKPHYYFDKE